MKRFVSVVILTLIINIYLIENAYAISGSILRPFKELFKVFKGPADDVIKNSGKIKEEAFSGIKKKTVNEGVAGPTQDSLVLEKVGAESHSIEFASLKKSNRESYIKRLKKKKIEGGDELLDLILDDGEIAFENEGFKKYIIFAWIGKIYANSDYYSQPKLEEKMLLVCSNLNEVFYFSLLMEQDPKRAFLVKNKKLNNDNSSLPIQELAIIEDSKNAKIMSTLPENGNKWPTHYFTIYNDQNFYYDQVNSGNVAPELIKNKISQNTKGKNNCSKATYEGLL
jgi:hypothetical protein